MAAGEQDSGVVVWRVRLKSPPEAVFRMLSTAEGRQAFWAESALEVRGRVLFEFPSGASLDADVLASEPPERFALRYFGGSRVEFRLASDGARGADAPRERSVRRRPGREPARLGVRALEPEGGGRPWCRPVTTRATPGTRGSC